MVKKPKVSLSECYYDPMNHPYDNEILEDYRADGIFEIPHNQETPYSIKITKDKNATYETTKHYSTATQDWIYYEFYDEDDPEFVYDPANPRAYNPELWDYYYDS